MNDKDKTNLLERLESEAQELLDKFKEHPIRSIVYTLVLFWGIKQIRNMLR